MEIISNRTSLISANNHILNTLFMKFFDNTFGSSEISLRFQSILAHITYMFFTFLLLRNFRSAFIVITGFIILNVNPYLLEFFSLARGYALAISFMMAGIYFFLEYLKTDKQKHLTACLVSACLAALANFALLNFFFVIILIHQIILFLKYKNIKESFLRSKPVLVTIIVMAVVCYEPLRKLIKYDQFNFGGETGIWADTVHSIIDTFLYNRSYESTFFKLIESIVIIAIISSVLIAVIKLRKSQITREDQIGLLSLSILISILLSNSIQHYLLGAPYFVERFALFLTPLFLLVLIFLLNNLFESGKAFKITGSFIAICLTGVMIVHLTNCINFSFATNWDYDADTKNMILDLSKEKETIGKEKIKLGITWLYEPTVNFYRVTKKLDWLEKVDRKGIEGDYDFCYYYYLENDGINISNLHKVLIKKYPVSGALLLK
jgi:hypothetical protein